MRNNGHAQKKSQRKRASKIRRAPKTPLIAKITLCFIIILVLAATAFKLSQLIIAYENNANVPSLPELKIYLSDVTIESIDQSSKDTHFANNSATLVQNGETTILPSLTIKGRGNSTWHQPKNPYQIKFDSKVSFFSYAAAKKWILLANYVDPTHLRNATAFYLENLLAEKFPIHGDFVELYIDDTYRGLYYLTEKVELGKSRVSLTSPNGVVMELDNLYSQDCLYSNDHDCLTIKDAVNDDIATQAGELFLNTYNQLESAAQSGDYQAVTRLIDVDSFAKYFLLSEFSVDPDAYNSSFYLHKDGPEDKIHAGPGWDYDFAFGNTKWGHTGIDPSIFHSPFETTVVKRYIEDPPSSPATMHYLDTTSHLFYHLLEFPEFEARIKEIFDETLYGHKDEVLDYIKAQADYIRGAAYRDQARWKLPTDFNDEVNYLVNWVSNRFDYFSKTYHEDTSESLSSPSETPDSAPSSQ